MQKIIIEILEISRILIEKNEKEKKKEE